MLNPAVNALRRFSVSSGRSRWLTPQSSSFVQSARNWQSLGLQGSLSKLANPSSLTLRSFSSSATDKRVDSVRNIAIIAHVDHGKTTLVDAMLSYSSSKAADSERVMDYNALEKERGITILSKVTSLMYEDTTINIVDTPGHADFGGEVERILSMVDGVCLLVDAFEGPMAQTKFVLSKALKLNLRPLVLINKVDRPTTRIEEVESEILDLFCSLECTDDQLDYKVLYCSGKNGWVNESQEGGDQGQGMIPLLENIISETPAPLADAEDDFKMLVSIMESDTSIHLGKMLVTGKVVSGKAPVGSRVKVIDSEGNFVEEGTLVKVLTRDGVSRRELPEATAGNIVTVAGLEKARVTHTVCNHAVAEPVPSLPIDPPTFSMFFSINDSPLAGKEGGTKLTTQAIKARLEKETESNVTISVQKAAAGDRDAYEVLGRGELHLGILVETMRREGYELSVSPPQVLLQEDGQGGKEEPAEEVMIDCKEGDVGFVMESMVQRKAEMVDSEMQPGNRQRMRFIAPSRGLVGFRNQLIRQSRGDAVMTNLFHGYIPYQGKMPQTRKGVMVSTAQGSATAYALETLEARGSLFVEPGDAVYEGQIIGEHSKATDIEVNPTKAKAVTNVRAAGKDETVRLVPKINFQLEDAISYIVGDELVEATPTGVRMRKKVLEAGARKRSAK